jgi:hypothetical protein
MSYIGTAFTADVANAGAINKLLQSVGAMTAFFVTPLFGRHQADSQSYLYEVSCPSVVTSTAIATVITAAITTATTASCSSATPPLPPPPPHPHLHPQVIIDGALLAAAVIGVTVFLLATPAPAKPSSDGI